MGNATEELKKIAKYVTTSVNEDGLYNAFKDLKIID
jgi:hydroxymethylpyrimidine pyrophosphatase-like HAD family hydrolase